MSVLIESNNFANAENEISKNLETLEDRIINPVEDRIYLHVPYSCRDKCRFYGGRWDKHNKKWYFINDDIDVDREELMEWKEEGKKTYYRISYDRREKAKSLGMKFDKDKKKWYHYEEEEIDIDEIKKIQKW